MPDLPYTLSSDAKDRTSPVACCTESHSSAVPETLVTCAALRHRQSEALEELLGLEDASKPATQLPRLLLENRALDKLLSGFVAVSLGGG